MTTKGKIVVTISALLIAAGAGYLIYKYVKKDDKPKVDPAKPDVPVDVTVTPKPPVDPTVTPKPASDPVVLPPTPPVKPNTFYKIYASTSGTPIWTGVNDVTPYRFAGDSELLGVTKMQTKKSYAGNSFYEVTQPDGKLKYVSVFKTKFKA